MTADEDDEEGGADGVRPPALRLLFEFIDEDEDEDDEDILCSIVALCDRRGLWVDVLSALPPLEEVPVEPTAAVLPGTAESKRKWQKQYSSRNILVVVVVVVVEEEEEEEEEDVVSKLHFQELKLNSEDVQ